MNRLKSLDLLPLTFWQEYLDNYGVFFFQNRSWSRIGRATNKIIPKARITRPTRSSSSGVIKFVEPECQAATYQKSY